MSQKDIKGLFTIPSSRGVAKVVINLKSENIAIYRFDDLDSQTSGFNLIIAEIED